MKANMVVEIHPGKKVCTDASGRDCQFFEEHTSTCGVFFEQHIYTCNLFREPVPPQEYPPYNPLRCQACLDTFKEDEK